MAQRGASPNTVASYRDSFRLLLRFAAEGRESGPVSSTSPTSTRRSSALSWSTWRWLETTLCAPTTTASPRSTRCSGTQRSATLNMPLRSSVSSPSRSSCPTGKGTARLLRAWLAEAGSGPAGPLFPTTTGGHMSRDAIEHRIRLYVERAAATAFRCNENGPLPTRSTTLAPCASGPKGSRSKSSRSSSVTRTSRLPRPSTSTRTYVRPSKPFRSSPRPRRSRAAIAPLPLFRFLQGL
jgi:hypothetical protein